MVAGLSSCNGEIKDVKVSDLVGTWDLVSETTVFTDGRQTTSTVTSGEYIVIGGTVYYDGTAFQNGGETYLAHSPLVYEPQH